MWDVQEGDGHCEVGTGKKKMVMMIMMMIMMMMKVGSSMLYLKKQL
jgi:hypothetical protein